MNHPKVTVGVVLFGDKYLSQSLPSLFEQDYPNIEFVLLDQDEEKGYRASELIGKMYPNLPQNVLLLQGANLWHSGGHNWIIKHHFDGEFYLCASYDMLYAKNAVSEMVKAILLDKSLGSVGANCLYWDKSNDLKTEIVDSLGLELKPWLQVIDRGQGKEFTSLRENDVQILGISGALILLRRSAIESVEKQGLFFDPNLHYKNDVDLAYRLIDQGWNCAIVTNAFVWHDRQLSKKSTLDVQSSLSSIKGDVIIFNKLKTAKIGLRLMIPAFLFLTFKKMKLLMQAPNFWKILRKENLVWKNDATTLPYSSKIGQKIRKLLQN